MGERPDPDELLERVVAQEAKKKRGKLTIFFGAAPGVGKTYTMLEAARIEMSDAKRDVAIGIVETHGRYDTGALIIGLELLPRRTVEHRGVQLDDLDLAAVIARHPDLVLVDELAHTNAPGGRHTKRWQDVEEILAHGIDVFTTLNVQHLESLKDVVAQVTGVTVRETVPDSVFERAHEVRVVDLPVDELLERLREGKVYVPAQAERAVESFFKEGNLIALRELALRRTAERVDAQMRLYKAEHGIDESWHTGERVLVCVSPSPSSAQVIRGARRMATSLHAELIGLYVETPAAIRMSKQDRETLANHMRLIESLDGEPVTVRAESGAAETVRIARKRNVTKIVLGKPTHPRWRDIVRPSFLDDVVRRSSEIDVYVISGVGEPQSPTPVERDAKPPRDAVPYAWAGALVATATTVSWLAAGRSELADIVMIHLLAVVIAAMRFGYGPSLFAAVLSVAAVDVLFVPPYFSFAVTDFRHVFTFGVMFVVALVISHLTKRIRDQADSARERERRTASLYAISRELGVGQSRAELLDIAGRHLHEMFDARVEVFLPNVDGVPERVFGEREGDTSGDERIRGVVEWVWLHRRAAGLGTDTLPASPALVVPIRGSRGRVGVLALTPVGDAHFEDPDARQLVETFSGLVGSAIERTQLTDEARRARLRAETEHLRNALLSSVSHDFRTPLGVVTGATSVLLDEEAETDDATKRELLQTAHDEAERLSRLVRNLLDMTRLDAGALTLSKTPSSIEEVVGSALARTADRLHGRAVATEVPHDLVVPCDPALVEQVVINLLENATKYAPAGTPILVAARRAGGMAQLEVSDRGPGVPKEHRERIFDKFYRAREGEGGGVGLGLTICRGIVVAHGGTIEVLDREGGGATFRIGLPLPS